SAQRASSVGSAARTAGSGPAVRVTTSNSARRCGYAVASSGTRDAAPLTLRTPIGGDPFDLAAWARVVRTFGTEFFSTKALRVTNRMSGGGVPPSASVSAYGLG